MSKESKKETSEKQGALKGNEGWSARRKRVPIKVNAGKRFGTAARPQEGAVEIARLLAHFKPAGASTCPRQRPAAQEWIFLRAQ